MAEKTDTISARGMLGNKVLGVYDANLKMVKDRLGVSITTRNSDITVKGEAKNVEKAVFVIDSFIRRIEEGKEITEEFSNALFSREKFASDDFFKTLDIYPRTKGQKEYLKTIKKCDITFATGPAGTGKTYLAVACAVDALSSGTIKKIVLVRPAVEAGESLGFLPGDLREKIHPYLMPVYDALYQMLEYEKTKTYLERGIIEVIPIAFMRGRTFHESFVIMDEGQNTSRSQMLMFLTRMGVGSRVIVTGDVTQIDLPPEKPSGLLHALKVLKKVKGIGITELQASDIVRHSLVKEIVRLYKLGK